MRDNLVFSGIPEHDDEDCEKVTQNFLKTKQLKLDNNISFKRVHRLGKRVPNEIEETCGKILIFH